MKFIRLFALFSILAFASPIIAGANPSDGKTCTSTSGSDGGLPECFTPDDNACYTGGVLYREENQDGCPTDWYWKAGWYLARVLDGRLDRKEVPAEFVSVLPPQQNTAEIVNNPCTASYNSTTGIATANFRWEPQLGQTAFMVHFIGNPFFIYSTQTGPSTSSGSIYSYVDPGRSFTSVQFELYASGNLLLTIPCNYTQM